MSLGKSRQSSEQSSENHLDPDIKSALLGNYGDARAKFGNMPFTPLTGDMVQKWQNPYTEQVIDNSLADLDRARLMTNEKNAGDAMQAGAFGGSRHGVLDSLTNRGYAAESGNLAATLRSAGYDKALETATGERNAEMNWPLLIQQLLNQSLGLMGNPTLGTSTGQSSGWSMSASAPSPSGG